MIARRARFVACALFLGVAACGRDSAELCADFVDECGDQNSIDDCRQRADALAAETKQKGCYDLYEAYIGCVDDLPSLCDAADGCAGARDDLDKFCGVHFE